MQLALTPHPQFDVSTKSSHDAFFGWYDDICHLVNTPGCEEVVKCKVAGFKAAYKDLWNMLYVHTEGTEGGSTFMVSDVPHPTCSHMTTHVPCRRLRLRSMRDPMHVHVPNREGGDVYVGEMQASEFRATERQLNTNGKFHVYGNAYYLHAQFGPELFENGEGVGTPQAYSTVIPHLDGYQRRCWSFIKWGCTIKGESRGPLCPLRKPPFPYR
jgi:hypothetical protein